MINIISYIQKAEINLNCFTGTPEIKSIGITHPHREGARIQAEGGVRPSRVLKAVTAAAHSALIGAIMESSHQSGGCAPTSA